MRQSACIHAIQQGEITILFTTAKRAIKHWKKYSINIVIRVTVVVYKVLFSMSNRASRNINHCSTHWLSLLTFFKNSSSKSLDILSHFQLFAYQDVMVSH